MAAVVDHVVEGGAALASHSNSSEDMCLFFVFSSNAMSHKAKHPDQGVTVKGDGRRVSDGVGPLKSFSLSRLQHRPQ